LYFVLGPRLGAAQHLNNWPAQVELARFEVCAVEVNERATEITAPVGRIAIELVNRSAFPVRDATFSVRAGSEWYHITVRDLAPGERRRVEREADFGAIEVELSGDFSGWAKRPGEIYWDAVRLADSGSLKLARRPAIADVQPIPDCPRFDISGIWKSPAGAEMRLTQRGNRPRGFVTEAGGYASMVSGTFDGQTFAGVVEGSGPFRLSRTAGGKLEGHWTTQGQAGQRTFHRMRPGSTAARD
jgi:hypothetical protein